ncbi:MAG: transcriptional repressor [bacterium]|nr:transcriptional repressor [bacterium]
MTARRGTYRTKQRDAIASYLAEKADRYLSVDEVWAGVSAGPENAGRSTVYRTLEAMFASGAALKAMTPSGEARYRMAVGDASTQLVCLNCGHALPLDCSMLADFSAHMLDHHGFKIDATRTVLYGICEKCREESR